MEDVETYDANVRDAGVLFYAKVIEDYEPPTEVWMHEHEQPIRRNHSQQRDLPPSVPLPLRSVPLILLSVSLSLLSVSLSPSACLSLSLSLFVYSSCCLPAAQFLALPLLSVPCLCLCSPIYLPAFSPGLPCFALLGAV